MIAWLWQPARIQIPAYVLDFWRSNSFQHRSGAVCLFPSLKNGPGWLTEMRGCLGFHRSQSRR